MRNLQVLVWIWCRFSLRFLLAHWQRNVAVLGFLALIAAALSGIWRAAGASVNSFTDSMESLTKTQTIEFFLEGETLPERLLAPLLKNYPGDYQLIPLLDIAAEFESHESRTPARIWGTVLPPAAEGAQRQIFASKDLISKLGDRPAAITFAGRSFDVEVQPFSKELELLASGDPKIIFWPLKDLQQQAGLLGQLSSVRVRGEQEFLSGLAAYLKAEVPQLQVLESSLQSRLSEKLVQAYRKNLQIVGLMALLVALVLVFNLAQMALVGREKDFAFLSLVGLSPRSLMALVLAEIGALAALGALLGLVLGKPLSNWMLALAQNTAETLYQQKLVPHSEWLGLVFAGLTLVLACLAVTLIPARQAARQRAGFGLAQTASSEFRRQNYGFGYGVSCLIFASFAGLAAFSAYTQNLLFLAYLSAFCVVATFFCATAFLCGLWVRLADSKTQHAGVPLLLAVSGFRGTFSLNQISAAALAFALSLAVGLGVMVDSFKITLDRWIEHTFQADLYIKAEQKNVFRPQYLPSDLYHTVRSMPETLSISRYSAKLVELSNTAVFMGATDFDIGDKQGQYRVFDGSLSEVVASAGLAVGVSEPAAKRLQLRVGSSIPFQGRSARVAAIFRDYSSEQGMILMHYPDYERLFGELPVISLGVYGKSPQAVQSIAEAINSKSWHPPFKVTRSEELRQLVRRIFTETFKITSLIEIVVLAMCMLGLFSSAIQRLWQRRTELQILQKLGTNPAILKSSFLLETLLLLLPSLVGGLLGGCVLAAVLVYLINPLSFGWTIDWELSFAVLARNASAYVLCGILVSAIAIHFNRDTKKMLQENE